MKKAKYFLLALGLLIITFIVYLYIDGFSIFRDTWTVVMEQHRPVKNENIEAKLSVESLHNDMEFLRRTIEDVGVNPYLNISKDKFYREFDSVKAGIDQPMTVKEFYKRIVPLIHSLKDSHTSFMWCDFQERYAKNGGRFFPIAVELGMDGKILVDRDCGSNGIAKGTEIEAINGIPSAEIFQKILTFEKGATYYPRVKGAQDDFRWLLWEAYDFEGPFDIKLPDKTVTVQSITQAELDKGKAPAPEGGQDAAYSRVGPGTGLLSIKTFLTDPTIFSSQIQKAFSDIQRDTLTNLIIDLRDNGGGTEINGAILIDHIWDKPYRMSSKFLRKKSREWVPFYWTTYKWWIRPFLSFGFIASMNDEAKVMFGSFDKTPYGEVNIIDMPETQPTKNPLRFHGNVCVLINHNVGSAAVGFVGAIKDYHIATLIGEETAENTNGSGDLYPFDLPNSHLFAFASTTFMLRPNGDPTMTHGELPDYKVTQSEADLKNGTDAVLEFAKKMLIRPQK